MAQEEISDRLYPEKKKSGKRLNKKLELVQSVDKVWARCGLRLSVSKNVGRVLAE